MKDRGTGGRDWFKDIVSHGDKGIIEQSVELNGVTITVYCDDSCVELIETFPMNTNLLGWPKCKAVYLRVKVRSVW